MESIQNKTAAIIGASRGIGYSIAEELLRKGAKKIAMIHRSTPRGQEAVTTLQGKFGKDRVVYFPCDITKTEDFKKTFKEIVKVLGGLDILVNNAGIQNDHLIEHTFNLNVVALIHSSLMALNYMGKHKGGKGGIIINISSLAGIVPVPSLIIYSASKFAVVAFGRCLQAFYDKTNVRVLTLCPGFTISDMQMGKVFSTRTILDFVDDEMNKNITDGYIIQSCEHVANVAVDFIQKGENGTISVVQNNEPGFAIEIPSYIRKRS